MEYSTYGTQQYGNVKAELVGVRLTPKQKHALERLAQRQQVTRSEAMRRLIDHALMVSGEGVDNGK